MLCVGGRDGETDREKCRSVSEESDGRRMSRPKRIHNAAMLKRDVVWYGAMALGERLKRDVVWCGMVRRRGASGSSATWCGMVRRGDTGRKKMLFSRRITRRKTLRTPQK